MQKKHPSETIVSYTPKNGAGSTAKHKMVTVCISNLPGKQATEKSEESDGLPARLARCFSSALDLSCLCTKCLGRPI